MKDSSVARSRTQTLYSDYMGTSLNKMSKKSLQPNQVLHCLLCTRTPDTSDRVTFPSCKHSFCKKCMLDQHHSVQRCTAKVDVPTNFGLKNYHAITCPTCLDKCEGHRLQLDDLPVDHSIYRLLDSVKIKTEQDKTDKDSWKCSYSKDSLLKRHKTARWKCVSCKKLFCESCFQKHEEEYGKASGSNMHVVVKTGQLASKVSFHCRSHAHHVTRYCNKCSMLICEDCAKDRKSHEGHDTENFKSILQKQKDSIPEKQQEINAQIRSRYEKKAILDKLIDKQWQEYDKAKKDIARQIEMFINSIKKHGHELLQELEQRHVQSQKLYENHTAYLDHTIHQLCTLQYFLKELSQEGKEPIILLHNADLTQHINAFSSDVTKKIEAQASHEMHRMPEYQNSDLSDSNTRVNLGNIQQKVHEQVTMSPEEEQHIPEFFPSVILYAEKQPWPDPPKGTGPRTKPQGLLFTKECLLSAELESHQITAYRRGFPTHHIVDDSRHKHFLPRALVHNSKTQELYVTDDSEKCIRIFDSGGNRVVPKLKNMYNQFASPCGIGITSHGEIVISDISKNSIILLSKDWKFIREFDGRGTTAGSLNHPAFIWVDDSDRIIISDRDNNRICIFNTKGECLTQFNNAGQLQSPAGVCGDEYGNIIVADNGNHRILRFYPNGRFRDVIIQFTLGSMKPYGITMSEHGELAISDLASDKIEVYKIYNYS